MATVNDPRQPERRDSRYSGGDEWRRQSGSDAYSRQYGRGVDNARSASGSASSRDYGYSSTSSRTEPGRTRSYSSDRSYDASRYDAGRYDAGRGNASRYDSSSRYDSWRYEGGRYSSDRYGSERYSSSGNYSSRGQGSRYADRSYEYSYERPARRDDSYARRSSSRPDDGYAPRSASRQRQSGGQRTVVSQDEDVYYERDSHQQPRGGQRASRQGYGGGIGSRIPSLSLPRFNFNLNFDFYILKRYGIIALGGIAAIIIGVAVFSLTPVTIQVDGKELSVARATTYGQLVDGGNFDVPSGNLVAVDGSILEEGAGNKPKVFLDGAEVSLGDRVSEQGNITAEPGEDAIEEYTAVAEAIPIETRIVKDKQYGGDSFNFYNGILHLAMTSGEEGRIETRTGAISGKTATVEAVQMKPRVIDNIDSELPADRKLIALTFDDGPNPSDGGTRDILKVLKKYDAKGTFFVIGEVVEEYPELTREMAEGGHQVASHTYSHDAEHSLDTTTEEDAIQMIAKARKAIKDAVGYEPTLVRPTGGNVRLEAIEAIGDLADGYICWNLDTFDYNLPGSKAIVDTVVDGAFPGAVVLMHDGGGDRSQTAEALNTIIPKLQQQGYEFVTVDEMIAAVLEEREKSNSSSSTSSEGSSDDSGNAEDSDNADSADNSEESGDPEGESSGA